MINYYLFLLGIGDKYFKWEYKKKENTQQTYNVKGAEVLKVKKYLKGLVVSPKDKNIGQLRVECPIRIRDRIKKEVYDSKCFSVSVCSHQEIMKKLRLLFLIII